MLWPFAVNRNCVAASRTWPMLPGADWNFSENTVCTESTIISAGLTRPTSSRMRSMQVSGEQVQRRIADAEPIAARLDLMLGFFARRVEHRADALREVRRRLQQQRGLADARLAAEQHQRSGNDAAAQHAIEFADAGGDAIGLRRFDVRVLLRARCGNSRHRVAMRRRPAQRRLRTARSSTNEFHAPQSSHLPCHFGRCAPHSWQTKTGLACFIACHGR